MINIGGIVAIVVFYLLILIVGIWAAKKKGNGSESEEEVMLAGRNIGLFVGIFTMTGTIQLGAVDIRLDHRIVPLYNSISLFLFLSLCLSSPG